MWKAKLRLMTMNSSDTTYDLIMQDVATRIDSAATSGVGVLNLSIGMNWLTARGLQRVPTALDTVFVNREYNLLKSALQLISYPLPLIVIAAGNDNIDANYGLYPNLRRDFQSNVLVVQASDSTRARWLGTGLTPAGVPQGSNFGALIDIDAPGAAISAYAKVNGSYGLQTSLAGTSVAAPLVAGVAGLLLSFDPSITPQELRQYIISGAVIGNRLVQGVPRVNAYESLRLAAKRPGAPLCGNRIWAEVGTVRVERDGTTEVIYTTPDTVKFVEPFHGGRQIALGFSVAPFTRILNYAAGSWTVGSTFPDALPSSSYASQLARSHDMDSVFYDGFTPLSTGAQYSPTYGTSSSTGRSLGTTIAVPFQPSATDSVCGMEFATYDANNQFTGYTCGAKIPSSDFESAAQEGSVSPVDDRFLLMISRTLHHATGQTAWVPRLGATFDAQGNWSCLKRGTTYTLSSQQADVHAIPHAGGSSTPLWSRSSQFIAWLGFSEDGTRAAMARGALTGTGATTNCALEFLNPLSGAADTVIPNSAACGFRGPGGFASIRKSTVTVFPEATPPPAVRARP